MTDKVVPLKPLKPTPLDIMLATSADGVVSLTFNRALTTEEFEFFYETSVRTVHLMRGIELK